MIRYLVKRLILIPVTLFFIILVNFLLIQLTPGGPVESLIQKSKNFSPEQSASSNFRPSSGMEDELREQLIKQFGFDRPLPERFFKMVKSYIVFDFGKSYFLNQDVGDLIIERLPISLSLGLWSTLLIYLIAIPLGIYKAINSGSNTDLFSGILISIFYALPSFVIALILILLFSGNEGAFPLKGITSYNFAEMNFYEKVIDYVWHITLPTVALALSGIGTITILTKNSFLEEINKPYVLFAKSKGLKNSAIMYQHVFRNAMLVILSNIPDVMLKIFLTGSLLIEIIFSLNGLGLLGFNAIISRDYPIVFGTLYVYTLLGLIVNLTVDLLYVMIDPRINFEENN